MVVAEAKVELVVKVGEDGKELVDEDEDECGGEGKAEVAEVLEGVVEEEVPEKCWSMWISGRENLPSSRSSQKPFWAEYCYENLVNAYLLLR